MKVTGTGVAIALAVIVAVGLLFFGGNILAFISPKTATEGDPQFATTTLPTNSTAPTSMNPNDAAPQGAPLPTELPTTLTATDEVVGTGAVATAGTSVTVHYVGMLPDGTVFDSSKSHGQPFTFQLGAGQVIRGWDEGVAGMKVGGKRQLIIPPSMGYGSQGAGGVIPPNATLIFEVELLDVK
ncbi:MAG: FKBP-type peptidyl-prolyl cis-trans isomerase [Candidatus Pacebacteria bacterium]|nr:FKBP-type peptidyl-prolyl cis-trans isomerase [Candidatus Paceibacterota bacterium]